jgi:hypothetical protein
VFAFLLAPAEDKLSPFEGGLPIFTGVPDMFGATLGLSMKGGQLVAFPVLVVGLLAMLKPLVPRRFWLFAYLLSYLFLIRCCSSDLAH